MTDAHVNIKVPFYDVDMLSMAWHGHYIKYFEIARCALLDKIGYNYEQMRDSGYIWPVIDIRIQYIKPARFGMNIKVQATLTEYENRLKVEYLITDADTGTRLTKGYSCQVAVDGRTQEMLLSSPDILYDKLGIKRP